jgi:hypothetical protein
MALHASRYFEEVHLKELIVMFDAIVPITVVAAHPGHLVIHAQSETVHLFLW